MSRIGKQPITIPEGVDFDLTDQHLVVKGPKGTLDLDIHPNITVTLEDGTVICDRPDDSKVNKSLHGLTRALINNMVIGVTDGFKKQLEMSGVGYRANKQGNILVLNIGYSHPVEIEDPEGIETKVENQTTIIVEGINKQQVGDHAAVIRSKRPPEPYKGHGIRYSDEHIRRKEGKKA